MLLWLASFLVSLLITLSPLCSSISLSRCLIFTMFTIPSVLSSRILLTLSVPIMKLLIYFILFYFLLQKALFSFRLIVLYDILG